MGKVIILSGISGSGKSTYAKDLLAKYNSKSKESGFYGGMVSADSFFLSDKGYNFDASKLGEAHGSCFRHFISSLQDKNIDLIIVDNTNTTAVEIAPYVLGAAAYNWNCEIVTIRTSDVRACGDKNIHNVPESSIAQQLDRLNKRVLPPYWKNTDVVLIVIKDEKSNPS